jgi:hypothetical protein
VLAELGIVGLGIFCALLAFLVLSALELPWAARRLWLVCLGVWLVGVSSLTWEMRKPTWWLFGAIAAQHASLRRTSTASRRPRARRQVPAEQRRALRSHA